MTGPTLPATAPPVREGTTWLVVGAGVAGLATYAFQMLGTHALGTEAYAPISVLWTLQYLVFAVGMVAIEAYVTRATAFHPQTLPRDTRVMGAWILAAATVIAVVAYLLKDQLLVGMGDLSLTAGLIVAGFGAYAIVRGRLAGQRRYRAYGLVTMTEAGARVLVAAAVLAVVASTRSLAWVLPVGPFLVALWGAFAARRVPAPVVGAAEAGTERGRSSRFLAATGAANASAQLLLAGGPLVLIPLGAPAAEVSIFFITITAARTPISFALGGPLTRVLRPLVDMAAEGNLDGLRRVVLLVAGGTMAVAAVGAAAGGIVGDDLVATFFGERFRPAASFAALTGAAILLATGALLLNQVLVATHSERWMPLPWYAALATAAGVILVTSGTATHRVATGLVAAQLVALAGVTAVAIAATRLRAGADANARPLEGDRHS